MKLVLRSIRNVLRTPFRMILVVTLLGTSLMFVAATMSLSANSQQEIAAVHKKIGTAIIINYATNDAKSAQQFTTGPDQGGSTGGATFLGGNGPTPIPDNVVTKARSVQGVASVNESLTRPDMDTNDLKGSSITAPNGQQVNAPVTVNGIPNDATNFTLIGGDTPTLVSGRNFQASDANADVAMMSQALAQINHLKIGSTFKLKGTTFTLIGLYTTSNSFAGSSVIIPLATMQKVFGINGVDSVTVNAVNYEQVEAVAARLRSVLGKAYDVVTQDAQYSNAFSALQVAQNSIQIALVVSLMIAAAVIIFAVLMLVRERTAEIAILKTIGASHLQVLRQFWTEIATLSITSAALATVLLATLGSYIAQKFDIGGSSLANSQGPSLSSGPVLISVAGSGTEVSNSSSSNLLSGIHLAAATLNLQTLLIIVGVGIGLALLTSLIPTWFVSHIKPAEVLRKAAN